MAINQLAMQIIGHNTANVNTEGFSRRRLELSTAPPNVLGDRWHGGNGVDIQSMGRIRDRLVDRQIQGAVTGEGYWTARDGVLGEVEAVFDELGETAISDKLSQFWSAWHDLANDPESDAARYAVREKSLGLTSSINGAQQALANHSAQVNTTIGERVEDINQITSHIAALNLDIARSLNSNIEPSDLLDQRDQLVEQLSSIIDIKLSEDEHGSLNVYTNGQIIVQRDTAIALTTSQSVENGVVKTSIGIGSNGRSFVPASGELKALFDLRDQDIAEAMSDLNSFARELATAVNSAHRSGFGINDITDLDFFTFDGNSAESISVSSAILEDISNIATGGSAGAPGDNSVALTIAGLQNQRILNDGRSTLDEFYRQGVLSVSSKREFARNELDVQQGASENLRARRQSISGVSMDEEMARLIQVQNAYEAAAKIIKTVDEMMQTVLTIGA